MRLSSDGSQIKLPLLLAAICLPALASCCYAQVLGAEAYFYGDIPVPVHIIADDFIERQVVPKLNLPESSPLWHAAKTSPKPVDKIIDDYFKARGKPGADQRQAYVSRLMLLRQLRQAIIAYEQLPLAPEAYAAHFGERGFPRVSQKANYLAKAAAFAQAGDRPQKAALKAAVALIHEQDRRSGAPVFECHFENPKSRQQAFCTHLISQVDGLLRDVILAGKYPVDDAAVKLLTKYTGSSEESIRSRSSVIDTIQILLRGTVTPPAEDFRMHRFPAIRRALERRDDYKAALQQRESQLPAVQRPRVEQDPLPSFLAGLLTAAVGMAMYADAQQAERARLIAQNPDWKGHEKDERCLIMRETYTQGLRTWSEDYTYCMSSTGRIRVAEDHCKGVQGFCRGR